MNLMSAWMKTPRARKASALALFLALFLASAGGLRAQASPEQKPSEPAQATAHEGKPSAKGKAEEEDETAQFKKSPSVKFIAEHTGMSLSNAYWTSVVINFLVIAGLIVWAGKKALPGLLNARTAAIQKAMQEAQKAGAEARAKLAEIEARLQKLDVEIGMMRDAAEREAGSEEARIQAAAKEEANKIVASAEQEIAAAGKTARRQLTAHAAELAVGLAQKQIRVDAATDQALVRGFSAELASDRRKDGN